MFDREAIQYLSNLSPQVLTIHDTGEEVVKLIHSADITDQIKTYKKPVLINHKFYTLDSFLNYISEYKNEYTVIFVGLENTVSCLDYSTASNKKITLSMFLSEEYISLLKLFSFVNQKELWHLLKTSLSNCISDELFIQSSQIIVNASTIQEAKIHDSGLSDIKTNRVLEIEFPDPKNKSTHTKKIQYDWIYNGRIWECFNKTFEIKLRLEMEISKEGLLFRLNPKSLQDVKRSAQLDFVTHLKVKTGGEINIFEGEL